jgi:hypothetical protein
MYIPLARGEERDALREFGEACGVLPLPEIVQIAGSTARNLGLMGMGVGLIRSSQGKVNSS